MWKKRLTSTARSVGSLNYWWCWAKGASWICVGCGQASRKRPPAMGLWILCHLPIPFTCCVSIPYSFPPLHLPCICQVEACLLQDLGYLSGGVCIWGTLLSRENILGCDGFWCYCLTSRWGSILPLWCNLLGQISLHLFFQLSQIRWVSRYSQLFALGLVWWKSSEFAWLCFSFSFLW